MPSPSARAAAMLAATSRHERLPSRRAMAQQSVPYMTCCGEESRVKVWKQGRTGHERLSSTF
eukprot:353358-Chlamydomonas_euryale.AAC.5